MRASVASLAAALTILLAGASLCTGQSGGGSRLEPVSAFDGIPDKSARAAALFT